MQTGEVGEWKVESGKCKVGNGKRIMRRNINVILTINVAEDL